MNEPSRSAGLISLRWSIGILILLLLIDVWYRADTFGPDIRARTGINLWPVTIGESEPLDCDEAAYAYIGHRIVRGDVLYRDLTENKPPLGYWLYATAVAAGGYHELTIRLLPIPFVLMTIAVVWWIALRIGGPGAAVVAAGLYVVLSTDPFLYGNGAQFEQFINLFSTMALGLLVAGWERDRRFWWIFGAGVCLGAATLVKQVAIVPAVVVVPALLIRAGFTKPGVSRRWVRGLLDVIVLGTGILSAAVIAGAILLAQGAGRDAYDDIVLYGGALATDTLPEPNAPHTLVRWLTGNADPKGQLAWPFGPTKYLVWWGTGSWPIWLISVPALAHLMFASRREPRRFLVAAWTLATWLEAMMPGLYWPHYYLLPTPGIAIAIAITFADILADVVQPTHPKRRIVYATGSIVLMAAIGGTLFIQARSYLGVAPEQLTIRYKGGQQWVTLRAMARDLLRRSKIWDRPQLYVWGWQSPLHFYGRMDSPTRHFFVDNLLRDQADRNHPLIAPRTAEIMARLRQRPPELIFAGYAPFADLRSFLKEFYLPSRQVIHDERSGVGLWIRRDSYGRFEASAR